MHAKFHHKFSLVWLFLTFLISLRGMEHRSTWPTLTFEHNRAPATFTFGPTSLNITCGSFHYKHPLKIDITELSPIQKIQSLLIQKDCSEHKEKNMFTLTQSRAMEFIEQREQIIGTCIECLHGSITSKLQLLKLSFAIDNEEELSQELNTIFHRYLQTIIEEFYNDDGQLKECSRSDYENAARRIGYMFVELLPWDQCLVTIEGYKKIKVPGFEQFYNDVSSRWCFFKGAYFALREIYTSLYKSKYNFSERKNIITSNLFNKDLCKINEAYSHSDDAGVHAIKEKYSKQAQGQKPTSDAGSRKFLVKAYCNELAQSLEPIKRLKSLRQKYSDSSMIQHLGLVTENQVKKNASLGGQLNTVIFLISALHRIPQKRLEKNNNQLDQEFAQTYDAFFDNRGLPTIFKYNEEALAKVIIPSSIGNYGRIKERLMLYKLASLCIKPEFIDQEIFRTSLSNALQYLCHGLRDVDHAPTYHLLIEALYNALTNPADTSFRDIITCNFLPSEHCEQAVHDMVLYHARTLLHALDEPLGHNHNEFLHNSLTALSRVWARACTGSKEAQAIILKPAPTTAFVEENFLNRLYDFENVCMSSTYLQQRMYELGFNKIITANACALSAPALKKIAERCAIMSKHNEVPNFTAIIEIMHDAHVPTPITTLLQNALELWSIEKQTAHIREIAVTATHCAEVAYSYHKQEDSYYYNLFLNIGNGLYKYGCIVGQVVGNKVHTMTQGITTTSKNVVEWSIKSTAKKLEYLSDEVRRFNNAISGKGYYIPKDHYKDKIFHERYEEFMRAKQEQSIQNELEALAKAAPTSAAFLARVCSTDLYDSTSLPVKLTTEAYRAVEAYIHNFIDLSHEEKFKTVVEFALDYYVDSKIFSIASHMCKWLHHGLKEWIELKKLAQAAHEVELCEHGYQAILQTEEALVGAARKNLNPNVMKSEGTPILPGVKKAVDRISSEIIDYLRHGKGNVIKEFTSEIFQKKEFHIFSPDHLKGGIMKLGSTRDIIIEKFANIIMSSDKDNFIKAGENTISTQINGCKVILKVFVEGGKIIGADSYLWNKRNPRLLGNVFTYIMDIYK